MNMRIVADSSANLRTTDDNLIVSVPLTIRTDEKEFVDDATLDIVEMTNYLASYKGKSGSACPSAGDWYNAFGDAEYVFVVTITSNLSGAYNSARIAKEDYESDHPDRKVFLIDSLSTGGEMKLIAEKIMEYANDGLSFDDICNKITDYCKRTHLVFILKSLTNLANNGRVSPAVAKIAGLLNINIVGIASSEGTLEQKEKARGEKRAILALRKIMDKMGYAGGKVRIDHCFNLEDATKIKELILSVFPSADIIIGENHGLCSFYAERGGVLVGFEG